MLKYILRNISRISLHCLPERLLGRVEHRDWLEEHALCLRRPGQFSGVVAEVLNWSAKAKDPARHAQHPHEGKRRWGSTAAIRAGADPSRAGEWLST